MRLALIAALLSTPALGQQVVSSPRPEAVAVTVYRDPGRDSGGMNLRWLGGFALITETRTLMLPAGRSTIRFEGVAGGIVPVSAIVQGLPGGVIEKNRDRALLSPAALVDGSLGRHVVLRRTDPGTGRVREDDALIRSGSAGAVVIETKAGVEALRCSGLPETIVYDQVPPGLSATPTLSVETESPAPATVTAQLSYLASDFDWAANYVVRLAEDGRSYDLFAWLTLANGNGESFADAQTQAVAGRLNRQRVAREPAPQSRLSLSCWPMDSTSTHDPLRPPPPPPMPAPMVMMSAPVAMESMRADAVMAKGGMQAVQEELGDLKLYRIPERVTVAANAQKQVAMIEKANVPCERVYRFRSWNGGGTPTAATILLRARNRSEKNLGVPMPSGGVAIFERGLLVGESRLRDIAVGELVDIEAGTSPAVLMVASADGRTATVTNANPFAVQVEAERNGQTVRLKVPANGRASLRLPRVS